YLAFHKWHANTMPNPRWVGWGNFKFFLFEDPRFWQDLGFTVKYVVISVLVELMIGLLLASLLSQQFRGKNFFRVVYLIPMACPPIAVAFLWRMMLHPDVGVINSMLKFIGLQGVKWTTSATVAPFTIIMVDVWEWTPFMFLALYAAFQSLPLELYQAAAVDGATSWQMFTQITLPLITPVIITISLIRAIDAFKLFELVFGITSGGPGGSTESLSYYTYLNGMKWFKLGRGAALSWLFLIVLLILALLLILRFKRGEREQQVAAAK
ncbi:ABC transporter permease subunit, partial [candidate division KSB3 bacterium]|nr:ABC transporter permease subunit [candidate division KSB3 bacterium]MBD3326495.1 ABC transporter permease subunit [candidate division KSB3 bacterium]